MPEDDKVAALPLYKELQAIQNATDGPFSERDKKRIQVIETILNAAPDLRKTLVALDARQKKEIQDIVQKQRREPSPAFGQQYADLEKRHDKERDRYITDHQKAQSMRAEMRETEKRESLDRGLDQDKPKRTR